MGELLQASPSRIGSIGPPSFRFEAARGRPVRISPSTHRSPSIPQVRTSPSFRISETRPSINTHSSFARRGESPRPRAFAGLEQRLAIHKPSGLEALGARTHTRLVHLGSRGGLEADSKAALKPAVLRGREFSRQNIQNYDFQALFGRESLSFHPHPSPLPRGEGDQGRGILKDAGKGMDRFTDYSLPADKAGLPSTEKQAKPTIQEDKKSKIDTKTHGSNILASDRETINIEYKKYPVLKDKLSKILEQSLLPARPSKVGKPGVLEAAVNQTTDYRLQTTARDVIGGTSVMRTPESDSGAVLSAVEGLPGMTELPGLRIVTGAEARAVLMTGETAHAQRIFEAAQAVVVPTPELQPALNPLEQPQLIKTYQALLPALGHEKALNLVGQSVEKRVQMLNPEQKLALAEKIIDETDPEQLISGLSEEDRIRVEIYVKKIVRRRELKLQVYQPGMDAREGKAVSAWGEGFKDGREVLSGAELVTLIGGQSDDEKSPELPEELDDGSGDQFRAALIPMDFKKDEFHKVRTIHNDHKTVEVTEVITTQEATKEMFYEVMNEQIDQIVAKARQRALVMLANLG